MTYSLVVGPEHYYSAVDICNNPDILFGDSELESIMVVALLALSFLSNHIPDIGNIGFTNFNHQFETIIRYRMTLFGLKGTGGHQSSSKKIWYVGLFGKKNVEQFRATTATNDSVIASTNNDSTTMAVEMVILMTVVMTMTIKTTMPAAILTMMAATTMTTITTIAVATSVMTTRMKTIIDIL
ncbi:hypothetical protein BCR42DRAFT_3325 [Absidia repens]|uniref:Uncharacterized protein n=1 Tax=Absidia repens TaxID=90262 RepID=A0A1X2J048_9FUNG|nr:hypothetical protein BCR42DRAFT_3325 [Absidia repens]